jgi:hypothetical protein
MLSMGTTEHDPETPEVLTTTPSSFIAGDEDIGIF